MVDIQEISDYLKMWATDQSNYVIVKSHMVTIPDTAPILTVDQGLWGIKDIDSLGYLSTTSKTQLVFTSTYSNCDPDDIGKRIKINGNRIDELVLAYYKNEPDAQGRKIWWLSGSTSASASIPSGAQITIDDGTGAGTTSAAASVFGGGAIYIGHGLTGSTAVPQIILTDTEQGYNTLYLRETANDTTPAHLDLGNLTSHGPIAIKRAGFGGNGDASTTINLANEYLHLGGNEWNLNSWRLIGFGYVNSGGQTYSPAFFGFEEMDTAGNTHGDFVWGVRTSNSDVCPTIKMRLDAVGNLTLTGNVISNSGDVQANYSGGASGEIQATTDRAWFFTRTNHPLYLAVYNGAKYCVLDTSGNFQIVSGQLWANQIDAYSTSSVEFIHGIKVDGIAYIGQTDNSKWLEIGRYSTSYPYSHIYADRTVAECGIKFMTRTGSVDTESVFIRANGNFNIGVTNYASSKLAIKQTGSSAWLGVWVEATGGSDNAVYLGNSATDGWCATDDDRDMILGRYEAERIRLTTYGMQLTGYIVMGSVNIFEGGTNLLKTDDAFMCVGDLTTYGDVYCSGKYHVGSRNYIQWGTDTYLSSTADNVLQINSAAPGMGGLLGVLDVGGLYASWLVGTNGGDYSGNGGIYVLSDIIIGGAWNGSTNARNIYPYAGNHGNCGTNTYYWGSVYANYIMPGDYAGGKSIGLQTNHWAYVWADYLRYDENSQVFDALEDLALVKNYTTKTETRIAPLTNQEYDVEVIDVEKSLPHLLDEFGMRSPSRDIGFLLGCAKFEVLAREKLEQQVQNLQSLVAKGGEKQ